MEHTGPWDFAVEATEAALVVFLEDIFYGFVEELHYRVCVYMGADGRFNF